MIAHEGIDRNFQFLVLEVRRQLEIALKLCREPSDDLVRHILSRDNYTDTLKTLIQKKYISYFRHTPDIDHTSANRATALNVATINLERIADFCVNIALQVQKLTEPGFMNRFDYQSYFDELFEAIPLISAALEQADAATALRICRAEDALDQLYNRDYDIIREALRTGQDTDNLLHSLYIVHYLERMGDSLQNIGEAALFAATGEKLKMHEYLRLRDTLAARKSGASVTDYSINFNWETQSGTRIAKVADKSSEGDDLEAIFKKGQAEKLRKERANLARWEELAPGLTPRVLEFREEDDDAALLLEFLDGFTLRDLVLNGDASLVDQAMAGVERTLASIWTKTLVGTPTSARYMHQALSRLNDVCRLHPEFAQGQFRVGSLAIDSLEDLLRNGQEIERDVAAPFRVLIHGDFNADNIIFNHREGTVHLVDVHRSAESDYLQDVSVFLVSNFRIPVFDGEVRHLLNTVIQRFFNFAACFARKQNDATFDVRLALGLARSFITSTRFEIDPSFAKVMYMRAVYLLQKLLDRGGDRLDGFRINTDVLYY